MSNLLNFSAIDKPIKFKKQKTDEEIENELAEMDENYSENEDEYNFEERTGSDNPRIWFIEKHPDWGTMDLDFLKETMKKDFPHGDSFQTIFTHFKKHYGL